MMTLRMNESFSTLMRGTAVLEIYWYQTGMDRFFDYKTLVLVCGL